VVTLPAQSFWESRLRDAAASKPGTICCPGARECRWMPATRLLEGLPGDSRPRVILDVNVFQVTRAVTANGVCKSPNTFQSVQIGPSERWRASRRQPFQDLIHQLISGGAHHQGQLECDFSRALLWGTFAGQQNPSFNFSRCHFRRRLTLKRLKSGTARAGQLSLNESECRTLSTPPCGVEPRQRRQPFRMGSALISILERRFAPRVFQYAGEGLPLIPTTVFPGRPFFFRLYY